MDIGGIYEIEIEDMSGEGSGIGRAGDLVVFVEGALPGDQVRAEITKVKKRYALAEAKEIIRPSEYRRRSDCIYSGRCGGCVYRELEYEASCGIKEKQVRDRLQRIGKIEEPAVKRIIAMEDPYRYRNKARFPVRGGHAGCFERKSGRIVDIRDCLLHPEHAAAVLDPVRRYGEGGIREVTVRSSSYSGDVMLILDTDREPREEFIYELDELVAEAGWSLESLYTVHDGRYRHIAGARTITERILGKDFEISPASFCQVNPQQTEKLYRKVIEYMGLSGSGTLLDIYCGTGAIGLTAADSTGKVIGIEAVHDAVIDANRNAVINGIVNARYIEGRAEEVLPKLIAGDYEAQGIFIEGDVTAVVDPPREGCDRQLLFALSEAAPRRIVYVSCDPATLARDVAVLCERGYGFVEAAPVDMFPWTESVETVCLLSRAR